MIGLYVPGSGPLHRVRAGRKLLGLAVVTSALVAARSVAAVVVAAVVLVALVAVARIPLRAVAVQLAPMRWVVLVLVPFQVWVAGWRAAVVVVGTLVVAVAAAALVTLTTRVSEMLDALVRVLRPAHVLGVDPERVALVLALAVRAVPVLAATAGEVRDARRARGLERSARALVVPLVVRSVRHADRLGEALAARGVDD